VQAVYTPSRFELTTSVADKDQRSHVGREVHSNFGVAGSTLQSNQLLLPSSSRNPIHESTSPSQSDLAFCKEIHVFCTSVMIAAATVSLLSLPLQSFLG